MKIKNGFAKRNIAGSEIVVPVGANSLEFNAMITLNGIAAFLWDCLKNETTKDEVINKVLAEYDVDRNTAEADFDEFIEILEKNNILE